MYSKQVVDYAELLLKHKQAKEEEALEQPNLEQSKIEQHHLSTPTNIVVDNTTNKFKGNG